MRSKILAFVRRTGKSLNRSWVCSYTHVRLKWNASNYAKAGVHHKQSVSSHCHHYKSLRAFQQPIPFHRSLSHPPPEMSRSLRCLMVQSQQSRSADSNAQAPILLLPALANAFHHQAAVRVHAALDSCTSSINSPGKRFAARTHHRDPRFLCVHCACPSVGCSGGRGHQLRRSVHAFYGYRRHPSMPSSGSASDAGPCDDDPLLLGDHSASTLTAAYECVRCSVRQSICGTRCCR